MISLFGFYVSVAKIKLVLKIIAIIISGLICSKVFSDNRTSFSRKERKKVEKALTYLSGIRQTAILKEVEYNNLERKVNTFKKLKIFPWTDVRKEKYELYIKRLNLVDDNNLHITPEKIYVQDCYSSLPWVILGLVGIWFNVLFALSWVIAFFAFNFKLKTLSMNMDEANAELMDQLPDFLGSFYYRFRGIKGTFLLDAFIDDYLPLANGAMNNMLSQLNTDIKVLGDIKALDYLADAYKDIDLVYRFAKVATALRNNEENSQVSLEMLYDHLNIIQDRTMERKRKKRTERIDREIEKVLYIIGVLTIVFIVVSCIGQL